MRSTRLLILTLGLTALAACTSDEVSTPTIPPYGTVRFINAVADTGAVDIRMIDQVEYSAIANGLDFRTGTEHQITEAKTRKIRVFPTSRNINVTQNALFDADVEVPANSRITLLLVGSARAKTLKFVTINDDVTATAANSIAVRVVNAATGAINGYVVDTTTTAIADPASAANVVSLAASPYVTRAIGAAALRITDVGSATITASASGPNAAVIPGALPAASVRSAGTRFSVYYFPRGVAGSPQGGAALATPAALWFVDRNPADQ